MKRLPRKEKFFKLLFYLLAGLTLFLVCLLAAYYFSFFKTHRINLTEQGFRTFYEINIAVLDLFGAIALSLTVLIALLNLNHLKKAQNEQRIQQNINTWMPVYHEAIREFKKSNESFYSLCLIHALKFLEFSERKDRTIDRSEDVESFFSMLPKFSILYLEVNHSVNQDNRLDYPRPMDLLWKVFVLLFLPSKYYTSNLSEDLYMLYVKYLTIDLLEFCMEEEENSDVRIETIQKIREASLVPSLNKYPNQELTTIIVDDRPDLFLIFWATSPNGFRQSFSLHHFTESLESEFPLVNLKSRISLLKYKHFKVYKYSH